MSGWKIDNLHITVRQRLCEALYAAGHTERAGESLLEMVNSFDEEVYTNKLTTEWVSDFRRRCMEKLESSGDTAASDDRYSGAVSHYPTSSAVKPTMLQNLLIKRSKAYMAKGLWVEALNDANKVIKLDPLSPWGYERKHAALHKAGDYQSAMDAFEAMLSRISESSDSRICALRSQYVDPGETKATIRRAVQDATRDLPRVLINTVSGQLCDKSEQAASFESHPDFIKLVSYMTTRIDNDAIKHDVTKFYRYGMFSHKWENNEPLFEQVIRIVVYDLGESPTQDKLKMFCKIVLDAGLHWAWSDTCCINRADYSVLQEALVAIFKWYEESSLTIIFLCDVLSPSRRGDLTKSIWKSRAWIFQEYRASKVVRFYTKDWKLYMNLDIPNHKDSPEIISEMEEATGVSERALMALRPGLADIREKLWLASTRQTTLVEDMAYSLFGIFSASFPDVNGEGDQALGQLLAQLLRSSGDISILAWTGKCGSFNSCFPASITVFNQRPPPHIPFAMPSTKIEKTIARFCFSSSSLLSVMNLYGRLNELPAPSFCGQRLHLPCLVFKLWRVRRTREAVGCVFHAEADTLGIVEIRTEEDLFQFGPLYLVHPWIDFLLGRQPVATKTGTAQFTSIAALPLGGRTSTRPKGGASLRPPSSLSEEDQRMRALRVIARLQLPFGALLLAQNLGKDATYRRVAAETLITVQVEETTLPVLKELVDSVHVLDVL
ncbi:hypothetical protein V8E55_006609 [Tylopilus felleus]